MERSEPALVPQWYRLANGSTSNSVVRNSSKHSDENSVGLGSRIKSFGDQDRNLRSLSSNGSISRSSGKSQAYSSFQRSRDKNPAKFFISRSRENRLVLVDNGNDNRDSFHRTKKDAVRNNQFIIGRQLGSLPKRLESNMNSSALGGTSVVGSNSKTSFEKDFPSLQAEGRQTFSDGGSVLLQSVRTAVQSLPVGSPIITGPSVLAEALVKIEITGTVHLPAIQTATICQASEGSTMVQELAQSPSQVDTCQLSVETQRIEELALKKCKQLIPVAPSMRKVSSSSLLEKRKSKASRISDLGSLTKMSQQSIVNLNVRPPVSSDIKITTVAGNFQVLNRENGISSTAKAMPSVGKTNPLGLIPSAAVIPLKSPTDQNFKFDNKNGDSAQNMGERKPPSQAQNRNDFFNLLRKKSLATRVAIPDPSSVEPMSKAENIQVTSSIDMVKGNTSSGPSFDCQTENRNCSNGEFCVSDEPEIFCADNGETSPYPDITVDPEEEFFLKSLGWDKNSGEEALTEEEIHAFLKKYEKRRSRKVVPADRSGHILTSADG